MFTTCRALAILVALLAGGCAARTAPPADPERAAAQPPSSAEPVGPSGMGWTSTYYRRTSAGQPVQIGEWANFSHGTRRRTVACQSLGDPRIEVTQAPLNGNVSVRPASVLIRRSHSGMCQGRTVTGVEVIYTPRADFHGTDRVRYNARLGSGTQSVTANIAVE